MRVYCPQAFLSLGFLGRDDVLSENRCFGIGKSFLVAQLFQSAFMQCLSALEMLLQLQASEQGVVFHPLDMSHCHMCKSPPTRDWLRQHCCTIGALHLSYPGCSL